MSCASKCGCGNSCHKGGMGKASGETAWIAENYILPDEPIVTENFVEEVVITKTYLNGKIVERYTNRTCDKWYTSMGSGTRTPGKYDVAVGAQLNKGKIWETDFDVFSRDIDIIIRKKSDGSEETINCYVSDWKAHTYCKYKDTEFLECYDKTPDFSVTANVESGIYQTGMRYLHASKEHDEWAEEHSDGSIIVFIPSPKALRDEKGINVSEYELVKAKVYFKDEETIHEE